MGKLIFWIVVVFAVLLVARLVNVGKARARAAREAPRDPAPLAAPMVRCVECGVFLPRADARPVANGFHCETANCGHARPR